MCINFFTKYRNIAIGMAAILIGVYLLCNTGLHGDDLAVVAQFSDYDLGSFLSMNGAGIGLMGPPSYYLFSWAYAFLGLDALWGYDLIKLISLVLSIIFVYQFSLDYLPRNRALLAAVLFAFNPAHDTTMYWYFTVVYLLIPSIIMLSHYYVRKEKYTAGFIIGCIGSFMWYVSPPYGIGLAVIFILEKSYKKAAIFILPALLYISYYFSISFFNPTAEHRISHGMTLGHFIKNYLLEIPAFFDSLIGPSFWFKVYYSIGAIELFSMVLAILVIVFMIKNLSAERGAISLSLLGGLVAVLI